MLNIDYLFVKKTRFKKYNYKQYQDGEARRRYFGDPFCCAQAFMDITQHQLPFL